MHTCDTAWTSGNQPSVLSTMVSDGTEIKPKTLSQALAQADAKALLPADGLRQIGADLNAIARRPANRWRSFRRRQRTCAPS
jgi:hypothetical protein